MHMISKILKTPFNISHAAVISLGVHFVFLSIYSVEIFNKPTFPEKKYKKFQIELVKRTQVSSAKRKLLKVREPILHASKNPVLPKLSLVSISKPIRKFESKPKQFIKPAAAILEKRVLRSVQVRTSVSIQKTDFKDPVYSVLPKLVKNISEKPLKIVFPLKGAVETGKKLARGARFYRNIKQPLKKASNPDRIFVGKRSTLVATRSPANYSFKPQVKNMTVLLPEQDPLLKEELNNLWTGYTTKVRQMIARAKIYPPKARKKGQQGKIHLSFKIGKDGKVLKLFVEHSSGYEILDEAARIAITDAGPFPPIPEKLNKQYALLKLPISFVLR